MQFQKYPDLSERGQKYRISWLFYHFSLLHGRNPKIFCLNVSFVQESQTEPISEKDWVKWWQSLHSLAVTLWRNTEVFKSSYKPHLTVGFLQLCFTLQEDFFAFPKNKLVLFATCCKRVSPDLHCQATNKILQTMARWMSSVLFRKETCYAGVSCIYEP